MIDSTRPLIVFRSTVKRPLKIEKTKVLMTTGICSLMKDESIAEF